MSVLTVVLSKSTVCHATQRGPHTPATALWPSVKPHVFERPPTCTVGFPHPVFHGVNGPNVARVTSRRRFHSVNTPTPWLSRSPCTILACPCACLGVIRDRNASRDGDNTTVSTLQDGPYFLKFDGVAFVPKGVKATAVPRNLIAPGNGRRMTTRRFPKLS